jgi:ankyrin repeat domain-containing protein 50
MYRSLLRQLLLRAPFSGHAYWHWVEDECNDYDQQANALKDLGRLTHWFLSALECASSFCRIRIFVDGLDEANDTEARRILADIRHLDRSINKHGDCDVKFCFSCRQYPSVSVDNGLEINVDQHSPTDADLALFIKTRLRPLTPYVSDLELRQIEQQVLLRSGGMFLAAEINIRYVLAQQMSGYSFENILQGLDHMPASLDHLYQIRLEHVLQRHPHEKVRGLMTWLAFSVRPLSLEELRLAMASNEKYMSANLDSVFASPGLLPDNVAMATAVEHFGGDLLAIRGRDDGDEVQMIHQSVRDFFTKGAGLKFLGRNADNAELATGRLHGLLQQACGNFIQVEHKRWTSMTDKVLKAEPFVKYAVENWLVHASEAVRRGVAQPEVLKRLTTIPPGSDASHSLRAQFTRAYLVVTDGDENQEATTSQITSMINSIRQHDQNPD